METRRSSGYELCVLLCYFLMKRLGQPLMAPNGKGPIYKPIGRGLRVFFLPLEGLYTVHFVIHNTPA